MGTTLVVDKTGTLTEGKPQLIDVLLPIGGFDAQQFLRLAGSLEQNSEHPLAVAIVQGARKQGIVFEAVTDFRSVTAGGVLRVVFIREQLVESARHNSQCECTRFPAHLTVNLLSLIPTVKYRQSWNINGKSIVCARRPLLGD